MSKDIPLIIENLQKHIEKHNQKIVDDILKYGKNIKEQLDNNERGREVSLEPSWESLYDYFEAARQLDTWISKLVTGEKLDGIHEFQTKTLDFINGEWYKILIQVYKEKNIDPVSNPVDYHKKVNDSKIEKGHYYGNLPDGIYEFIYLILFVTNDTKLIEDWRKLHSHSWELRNMWIEFLSDPKVINVLDDDQDLFDKMLNFTSPEVQINTGGYGFNKIIVPLQEDGQPFDLESIFQKDSDTPTKGMKFSGLLSRLKENDNPIVLYYRQDDGILSEIALNKDMRLLERAFWHSFDYCFIRKKEAENQLVQDFIKRYYR